MNCDPRPWMIASFLIGLYFGTSWGISEGNWILSLGYAVSVLFIIVLWIGWEKLVIKRDLVKGVSD